MRPDRGHPSRRPILHHRIQNREQLPHAGRQHQLLRLPHLTESLIERPNHEVSARGGELVSLVPLVFLVYLFYLVR